MKHKSSRNDLTSDRMARFRKIEQAFLSRCRQFGYSEIKTSTIEPLYIFTAQGVLSDEEITEIYSFIDWDGWSGERVALRRDSTACAVRFYGDHLYGMNPRQKLCYVENHFKRADLQDADSWDEISERWQCGVENIGTQEPEADFEVISMAIDILREAGLKTVFLHLSYPSIIKDMIGLLALDPSTEKKIIQSIRDHAWPIVEEVLTDRGSEGKSLYEFLTAPIEWVNYSANYLENLKNTLPVSVLERVKPAFENFIAIASMLDQLGDCEYIIDFSMLGDLEYYTGIQFQILPGPSVKARKDILCGGGRYDHLIQKQLNLSESVPAVGFGLRLRNIMNHLSGDADKVQSIGLYIGAVSRQNIRTAQRMCDKLSAFGFDANISFSPVADSYPKFGLVIEVNHDKFPEGYQVLYTREIGPPLLKTIFGDIRER